VFCMETDLSEERNCYQIHQKVKAEGICISVLINNAGIGGTFALDEKDAW